MLLFKVYNTFTYWESVGSVVIVILAINAFTRFISLVNTHFLKIIMKKNTIKNAISFTKLLLWNNFRVISRRNITNALFLSGRFWFYPLQNENILSPIRYNITPPPPSRQQLLSEVHPMEMQYVELGYSKLASLIFGLISSHCVLWYVINKRYRPLDN